MEAQTSGETAAPRKMAERTHVKMGSAALIMWVKETAPAENEMTAPRCPRAWHEAIGMRATIASFESVGGVRSPQPHKLRT